MVLFEGFMWLMDLLGSNAVMYMKMHYIIQIPLILLKILKLLIINMSCRKSWQYRKRKRSSFILLLEHCWYFSIYPFGVFFNVWAYEYIRCACVVLMNGSICKCIFYIIFVVSYPDFPFIYQYYFGHLNSWFSLAL